MHCVFLFIFSSRFYIRQPPRLTERPTVLRPKPLLCRDAVIYGRNETVQLQSAQTNLNTSTQFKVNKKNEYV